MPLLPDRKFSGRPAAGPAALQHRCMGIRSRKCAARPQSLSRSRWTHAKSIPITP